MTKYSRITGKVFGATADATLADPEIGQFGSALAGEYTGKADVATIQSKSAWDKGFIGCVTPTTQFPPLPEMTGFGKVLSHQICYLLQQGIAEWDSGTTYYIGNWVSYNSSIYVAKSDGFSNQLPTNTTYWNKFTGGSSRNYGEYVTSSLPLTDNTLHLANGALLSQTDYPEFYSYIANLYNSLPSPGFQPAIQKLTGSNWSKIAYGNGLFVAVKSGGSAVSLDGSTWTEYTVSDLSNAMDITFDGTNFVVATNHKILTSSDGENWTIAVNSGLGTIDCIEYGNSLYVVLNYSTGYVQYASSLTGTWNSGGTISFNMVKGLTFGDGKFVALGKAGKIAYSTDAINWTTFTIDTNTGWMDIIYNEVNFMAISSSGYIVKSNGSDVQSWNTPTPIANLGNNDWTGLAYGNLKTIALGVTGYISIEEMPYTNVFVSEADWQSEYTTYGECGKYVYNSGANTVRIPAVNSYFTNTANTQKVGDLTPASIPNIKGTVNHLIMQTEATFNWQGAFYDAGIGGDSYKPSSTTKVADNKDNIGLDASRSSSVYSDSATTVNTQSIKQLVYIVVRK